MYYLIKKNFELNFQIKKSLGKYQKFFFLNI